MVESSVNYKESWTIMDSEFRSRIVFCRKTKLLTFFNERRELGRRCNTIGANLLVKENSYPTLELGEHTSY